LFDPRIPSALAWEYVNLKIDGESYNVSTMSQWIKFPIFLTSCNTDERMKIMFILKINDVSYGVRFQYRPVDLVWGGNGPERWAEIDKDQAQRLGYDSTRTVAQILLLNDVNKTSELIVEGQATCTLADKFVKREGREIALKKALAEFTLIERARGDDKEKGKPIRKAFWQAYFANHKNKRHLVEKVSTEDEKLLDIVFGKKD